MDFEEGKACACLPRVLEALCEKLGGVRKRCYGEVRIRLPASPIISIFSIARDGINETARLDNPPTCIEARLAGSLEFKAP